MDRDDARFVVGALASRISGDRVALDRLQATSLVRLTASAARLRDLAADWIPALAAETELRLIAERGGLVLDAPTADKILPQLQVFVDKLRELLGERRVIMPRNRHERRARAVQVTAAAAALARIRERSQ